MWASRTIETVASHTGQGMTIGRQGQGQGRKIRERMWAGGVERVGGGGGGGGGE